MKEIFYNFAGLNEDLFIWINQLTNIDIIPEILEIFSSMFFIANFAIAYVLFCLYFFVKIKIKLNNSGPDNNLRSNRQYFSDIYHQLVKIGICYALFGFVFASLKFSINMPRPFCSLESQQFITIANTALERCLSSFPSAHTGLSILVSYALWHSIDIRGKALCIAMVFLVAVSRITLAMHYPADILYSALVTWLVIIAGNFIYKLTKSNIVNLVEKHIYRLIF